MLIRIQYNEADELKAKLMQILRLRANFDYFTENRKDTSWQHIREDVCDIMDGVFITLYSIQCDGLKLFEHIRQNRPVPSKQVTRVVPDDVVYKSLCEAYDLFETENKKVDKKQIVRQWRQVAAHFAKNVNAFKHREVVAATLLPKGEQVLRLLKAAQDLLVGVLWFKHEDWWVDSTDLFYKDYFNVACKKYDTFIVKQEGKKYGDPDFGKPFLPYRGGYTERK